MDIRRLNPSEAQLAIDLSDKVFRDEGQKSMGAAFPYIFSVDSIENSYGYFVEDKLAVFMGLVPSTICIGNSRVHIYSLGSVCTHPDYRGHGYASEVLQLILSDLKETEAALLLISGGRSLYTRVGSRTFGEVQSFDIVKQEFNKDEVQLGKVILRDAEKKDIHSLTALAHSRPVRYEQSIGELNQLIKSEGYVSCIKQEHRVLVAEEEGIVKSFLIIGVPYIEGKTSGAAIEWAGDALLIKQLLKEAVKKYNMTQVKIKVPWHEKDLIETLDEFDSQIEQNQGTMLIIDSNKLLNQLEPYYEENNFHNEYKVCGAGEDVCFTRKNEEIIIRYEEIVPLLFNPDESESELGVVKIPFPYTVGLNYV